MIYAISFRDEESNELIFGTKQTAESEELFFCTSIVASKPEVVSKYIDIPGRSGALDFTEALGRSYRDRKITLTLECAYEDNITLGMASLLLGKLNGKAVSLEYAGASFFDTRVFPIIKDGSRYYSGDIYGRASVVSMDVTGSTLIAIVELIAEPFARSTKQMSFTRKNGDAEVESILTHPGNAVTQYPVFSVSGGPVTLFKDASSSKSVRLEPGKYEGHPFIKIQGGQDSSSFYWTLADIVTATVKVTVSTYFL